MLAIITGAARSIGAAIAVKLSQEGYNLALIDLNESAFTENNNILNQIKTDVTVCGCDVSNYTQCEETVNKIKALGTIDVLVNNAGITSDGLLVRMSEENYDKVIAVNQKSVFNMTKLVGAVMMKQRSGSIINISSVAGLYGNAGQFNYSASKGAIIAMTMTTAKELGPRGVRCNAIAPGFISTPMTDKLSPDMQKKMLEAVALGRYGEVQDVANLAAFLASDKSSYITGQTIEISGGLSM